MELNLEIVGILLVLIALMHIAFPRYFKWDKELSSLSLINKQMMYVHTFFIGLTVLLMGVLCLRYTHDILYTRLGQKIAMGLFVFWITRLVFQLAVFSPKLWKGKVFETVVHVVFVVLWTYVSLTFFYVGWSGTTPAP